MKKIIAILFILSFTSIFSGYFLKLSFSEKLIGFGVCGLFFLAFPLFAYVHWKDKNVKDYMLTKENLDKMKNREENN
jgi:hypothetical protein